jgi:uncharacterized protein DUF1552
MTKRHTTRRAVLRGLGGAMLGLPLLEYFGVKNAAAAGPPKRLLILTTPNGTDPNGHWPTGTVQNFQLSNILSPLEPFKSNLCVLRGVNNEAAAATGINGHTDTVRCMFTGRIASNFVNDDYTAAGGISVDQHIANDIGASTAFKSLEYVEDYIYAHGPNYASFYGPNQPVPFEDEPVLLFDRVFGDFSDPSDPAAEAKRADRLSVLHHVYDEYKALDAKLGKTDRARLAAHLDMVHDIEQKILAGVGAQCTPPGAPAPDDYGGPGIDIILNALACDLTRVASIRLCYWDDYGGMAIDGYPGQTIQGSYHDDFLHMVLQGGDRAAAVGTVKKYQAQKVADIIAKLQAIPEGTGTLFDNTLVLWADEFCHGYAHQHHEVPYVFACGTDRFFQMGRYVQYGNGGVSNNRLWNSLIGAMEASGVGQFGDPQFDNTPLPELA